jgi:hypothetical protein
VADIKELAVRFHVLFAGMERAHGSYQHIDWDQARADGKYTGNATTKREPITDALWEQHLSGKYGLGVIPIRDDSTCLFGAIDIDVYADLDPGRIASTVARLGLPLVPCRSKSGGMHLYVFFREPVLAGKAQTKLRDCAAQLGHGTAEIFPKQAKLAGDKDLGSWINVPYFNALDTNRYGVMATGDAMSPEEFLTAAEAVKVGPEFFDAQKEKKSKKDVALPDGPPCLNHLMEMGFPEGTWNAGVFNLGIYCRKAHPTDWQGHLVQLNAKNFPVDKWPVSDLDGVFQSLTRKDYAYTCSKQPLVGFCNQIECRRRKYGVGGGASSFPVLKGLRKLETTPPAWFLDVDSNGTSAVLELSTEELLDANAFQRKCTERLNVVPMLPTKVVWHQTVQQLLATVTTMPPPPEDSSTEGQFWELLERFCNDRAQAHTRDEILLGKPFTEEGRTYFRTADLLRFLQQKQFKDYKVAQVAKVLKTHKDGKACTHEFVNIGGKGVNLWSVVAFPKRADPFDVPDSIKTDSPY